MRRILVMGGTRFFGKRLVKRLLENGDHVTIATRGLTPDSFGDKVERIVLDREDYTSVNAAAQAAVNWDVVYDNICYTPEQARIAVKAFEGRTSHYVFTSTLSVYHPTGELHTEADFDPHSVNLEEPYDETALTYQKGKQLCEAVFYQTAGFPVAAVRFPIVLGNDDYTKRLEFHIERVSKGIPILIPNLDAQMTFIDSSEAAAFLEWAGSKSWAGPINACSNGVLQLKEIIAVIEQATGREAIVTEEGLAENRSPFGVPDSWYMDNQLARQAGFSFNDLEAWFPALTKELAARL